MTEILLHDIEQLNYRKAQNWLVAMTKIELYDFLADTGADPYGKPGADTRAGLYGFALAHVDDVGPCVLLDWIEQTGISLDQKLSDDYKKGFSDGLYAARNALNKEFGL